MHGFIGLFIYIYNFVIKIKTYYFAIYLLLVYLSHLFLYKKKIAWEMSIMSKQTNEQNVIRI
jgi:hypothetical protein